TDGSGTHRLGALVHLSEDPHDAVDLALLEEVIGAGRRVVGVRRLEEAPRLHHAVGRELVDDELTNRTWCTSNRAPSRYSPKASRAASRSSPTSERTKRPRPRASSTARSMSARTPAPLASRICSSADRSSGVSCRLRRRLCRATWLSCSRR